MARRSFVVVVFYISSDARLVFLGGGDGFDDSDFAKVMRSNPTAYDMHIRNSLITKH